MPSAKQNGAIAAAVALSVTLTASYEGLRTKPYVDPARKWTVCYGETERPLKQYTPDECAVMLSARQRADYAPAVLKCVPGLASHVRPFAASIDAAYNAGAGAFCRSPMARKFNAGDYAGGCDAFSNWRVTANGKRLAGLVRRRGAERSLCRRGLA
jgi:lysozyme